MRYRVLEYAVPIIFLIILYFIGVYITFDFNPLHWWFFATEVGRIFSAYLIVLYSLVSVKYYIDL